MKKQTAVEWLFEQMLDSKEDNRYELLEEAKKMEQEQIVKAAIWDPFLGHSAKEIGKLYYEEKYGKG